MSAKGFVVNRIKHPVIVTMEDRSFDHYLGGLTLQWRRDIDGLPSPLPDAELCAMPWHTTFPPLALVPFGLMTVGPSSVPPCHTEWGGGTQPRRHG